MRPVRIIATAIFVVAALAVTGCASRSADQTSAPASSAPSSVTTTQPTAASTTRSTAGTAGTTTTTVASPTKATCVLSPTRGPAGARVTLSCRGFAPSEQVEVTFGATVLATAKATASGQVAASFAVPSGFAGSTIPGRKDTFQAKGRQSDKTASATFTVASPTAGTCVLSPTRGLAGSQVTIACRGFAPSESVHVTFGAEVLAVAKATAGGQVVAAFAVPSGFAGSHYPGRRDTFQAKGRQSGTVASATFTVTG
jgi:large repetitive protein